jgi:hypothetical protein
MGGGGGYMGGGGGYMGGGGFRGGGFGGGFHGPIFGGHPFNGLKGIRGFGFVRSPFFGFGSSFGLGFYGSGFYSPGFYDYGYSYPYYDQGYGGGGYSSPQPNITVVYPPQQAPVYVEPQQPAHPVTHEYDQYGQEVKRDGSGAPLYLLAFKDKVIRAATAYWVDGKTLHYVTYEHEQKQAPLETLDRDLTVRLNAERHVELQLPQ